jgi:hypothetical protein
MKSQFDSKTDCCPEFDPIPWDDKTFEWKNKPFIKDKVCTLFYMPMNYSSVMKRFDRKVTAAGAIIPDWLCLSEHTSKWNMDMYLAVDKEISNAVNTTITGEFYSKVYEGPFSNTGVWMKDYETLTKSKGLIIKKQFIWYTTCPKCAKKYGKNYVVVIGQIE